MGERVEEERAYQRVTRKSRLYGVIECGSGGVEYALEDVIDCALQGVLVCAT